MQIQLASQKVGILLLSYQHLKLANISALDPLMRNCSLFILHYQQSTKLFEQDCKDEPKLLRYDWEIQYFNQIEICKSILMQNQESNSLSNSNKNFFHFEF